jgi:hypothetical protein
VEELLARLSEESRNVTVLEVRSAFRRSEKALVGPKNTVEAEMRSPSAQVIVMLSVGRFFDPVSVFKGSKGAGAEPMVLRPGSAPAKDEDEAKVVRR